VTALVAWVLIGVSWTAVAFAIGLGVGRTVRLREDRDDLDQHDADALAIARDDRIVEAAKRSTDPAATLLRAISPEERGR
jgi:hypothetical protein